MIQLVSSLIHLASADPSQIGTTACNVAGSGAIGCGTTGLFDPHGFVFNTINAVIMIAGALAVVMVIVGGLRYVLSGGDSAGIKGAKDTIMYALIGIAVALLSFAIVSFVIGRIS